jgi:subtilisin-like proprotein convertase family protein
MFNFYKKLLFLIFAGCMTLTASAQQEYWSTRANNNGIVTDKAVARDSYPKEFKLFSLDITPLRQKLFSIVGRNPAGTAAVITLPDADGNLEKFEVVEASNFDPALQAKFPQIRAYSGKSITHPGSTLKISIAPGGIQTIVFRANGKPTEYIEPYSADHTVYSVFKSQRNKGAAPWVCSTPDQNLAASLTNKTQGILTPLSNAGQLKTLRLAQSVTAEYSNYFGATASGQVALVLAAVNATLTRCNGCYEKDLAVHLNLIANTTDVFYYDPNTDPYSPAATGAGGAWNGQLQSTLTAVIGEANYDIGHLFGASGGGGNAGCIGCVCVNGSKGSGFTSPANAIPQGDDFDIDYVAHEVGHQLGGNHTFSFSLEGTGQNKEVGSGITIMGYAGITAQDVAPHSIDIFHETSIQQIQVNLATKSCPVTTSLSGINATPVVAALTNYTIPPSTPFALTGSATDANAGDILTYCWEQNDNATTSGASSVASPTKLTGPNWLSFSPVISPTRTLPVLATILAGNSITGPLPGGDAGANIEALSSVSRPLNFRLTVRDNRPYNSGTGAVGQTNFSDMTVTVDATTYTPFLITSQNSAITYTAGSTQTVTWSVGNTTAAPISTANVKISFSTDGGNTFTTLLASTPNDGTETFIVPSTTTTAGRIKVEAIGNIFFDINNAAITISLPPNAFTFNSPAPVLSGCPVPASLQTTLTASFLGTFTGPVNLTATGNPPGTTVVFGTNPLSSASPSTTVTLTGTNTLANGSYTITVTGTGTGVPTQNSNITYTINPNLAPLITSQPSNVSTCTGAPVSFSVVASGASTYQWQVSTNGGGTWADISGATAATYSFTAVTADNGKQFRCVVSNACAISSNSNAATLSIIVLSGGTLSPASSNICGNPNSTTITLTGLAGNILRWESSIDGGTTWTNIANTTATLTATNITQTTLYRVFVQTAGCGSVYSTVSTLTYIAAGVGPIIITSDVPTTLCAGDPALLTALSAVPGTVTVSSGPITVAIPDASATGVSTPLTVSGVPAAAIGSSASVNFNITHTWDSDLTLFLKAPNNQVLNLVNQRGGSADNFVNTTISSTATTPVSAGTAPFTGTFLPDGNTGAPAPAGFTPTATTFAPLYATAGQLNGVWSFAARDGAGGDLGTITSWSLTLNYNSLSNNPGLTYVWSPAAGLNATNTNPVAASPAVSTTYTVVATNGSGCTSTASISFTVNQRPKVTADPAATSVCANSSATFTVTGTGTGIGYQWQESTNAGVTWTNLSNGTPYAGVNTATLTINPAAAAMNNNLYRCVISGTCSPAANSASAKLTVKALPVVTVSPTAACGGIAGINGTLLTGSGADSYTWGPLAGLYTNATTTTAYTGTATATVYAAPTVFTTYTVTGTNSTTGCSNTATALINYTPPAPTITPSAVAMCLGDAAVRLTSSTSATSVANFTSGTISVAIPDNNITGATSTLAVSGIPSNATITGIQAALNITHTWVGDLVISLKAPGGNIVNLDGFLSNTGGAGATSGFTNTRISSAGTAALSSGTNPYNGIFRADAFVGAGTGPTGFDANVGSLLALNASATAANGTWTLAMYDGGPADLGTLTSWGLQITYVVGVPATAATWSPIAGLFIDPAATIAYTGTPRDTVYTRPTPSGVYPYTATVNSLPPAAVTPTTSFANNNGNSTITFNVRNNNAYPVTLSSVSSIVSAAGTTQASLYAKAGAINGAPGAISVANGWNQVGTTQTVTANGGGAVETLLSGLNLTIAPGQTYGLCLQALTGAGGFNLAYSTLAAGTYTNSAGGVDIITGTNIGYGGVNVPAAPTFTPRGFIGNVGLIPAISGACTSPAKTVVVTVNQPISLNATLPANTAVCTDKSTTFTVSVIAGTSPTYQWQVSTDAGNTFNNVSGGVYSGATTATLTITAPPVSMSGYIYRCVVSGAAPCTPVNSRNAFLTVNPLPTVVIAASPYQRLFPGLTTTLFSTVTPAASTYSWLKYGVAVPGANAGSLLVNVDGLGDYTLKVQDVNGCINTSNMVSLKDSASGKVFIYPNPNSGQFQVRYYSIINNTNLPRGINVYDSRGKRVLTQKYTITSPYSRMDVNLSNYSTGVYWIEVVDVVGNRLAMGRAEVLR